MNIKFTEQPFVHEDSIKKKKRFWVHIILDFYAFYLCVLKSNTLSSVVPTLRRWNLFENNLKIFNQSYKILKL